MGDEAWISHQFFDDGSETLLLVSFAPLALGFLLPVKLSSHLIGADIFEGFSFLFEIVKPIGRLDNSMHDAVSHQTEDQPR